MAILRFQGEHRFLSNFYPVKITHDDIVYPSVEHAYQASKTNSRKIKLDIANCGHAAIAKKMGSNLYKEKWHLIKLGVMLELVRLKFQDESLKYKLLMTGDEALIEGNEWGDVYWGLCKGVGENHLGKILMQVRSECKRAK
jgi:ribA/ribD-fused uncharacterized protein